MTVIPSWGGAVLGLAGFGLTLLCACQTTAPETGALSWRIAALDTGLCRPQPGQLASDLRRGSEQARQIAAILQRVRPSAVLLSGFDYDPEGEAIRLFVEDYLKSPQHGGVPLHFRDVFTAEVNRSFPGTSDLGHCGMAILSNLEIDLGGVRSFRELRWQRMPNHSIPPDRFDETEATELRLSTTSHWDVPLIDPDGRILHLLASHPVAPASDEPTGIDARRNHDEIRFWADYVEPSRADWIIDDHGVIGGLRHDRSFVILGNLGVDPHDQPGFQQAVRQLTEHPLIDAQRAPTSLGAVAAGRRIGGDNARQSGNPSFDTCQAEPGTGNLRLDYALPSSDLRVESGGVFWPVPEEADAQLIETSAHRLVWIDLL